MSIGGIKACCATGSLHTGTPTGKVIKLHGRDTYVAEPPSGAENAKGIVVVLPDIFGWTFANSRVLADEYAKKGDFLVFLPDFMNGYVVPDTVLSSLPALMATGLVANIKKIYHFGVVAYWLIPFLLRNPPKVVRPQIIAFFRGLKTSHPNLPVGAAGFCWGGQYTVQLCSGRDRAVPPEAPGSDQAARMGLSGGTGEALVVCGFTAHPSRLKFPEDIEAVELPLSIAASGKFEPQMSREQGELTKKILEGKSKKADGVEHEFVWYEGASHGFAVRADENDLEEAERGRQAEEQAIRWFTRWFTAAAKK